MSSSGNHLSEYLVVAAEHVSQLMRHHQEPCQALSGFSLMLRCDPTARIPEPLARTDAAGQTPREIR